MLYAKCGICQERFYVKPSWIKRGWGKYCSRRCQWEGQKHGRMVNCFTCEKQIYKTLKDLKKSKSKKYFCSKSCQTIWRNQIFRGSKHGNWKGGEHVEYRKILIKNKIKQICAHCGIKDVRVLCAHHFDKNKRNNDISNLKWLCHNCHYLVHNHNISL